MFDIETASDLIMAAPDVDGMAKAVLEIRNVLGLANIVYHRLRAGKEVEAEPLLILSYDDRWVERYVGRDYFKIDPVVRIGTAAVSPIDWSKLDRSSFSVRRMFAEADSYGVGRQGLTIPIRGPGGERALFTVTSNADDREWARFRPAAIGDLSTIGQQVHDRVAHITGTRIDEGPRLSPREMECLNLIVRGKSSKQISGLLAISESSVRLVLRSIRYKLKSATLHQAVARAVSHGLVVP